MVRKSKSQQTVARWTSSAPYVCLVVLFLGRNAWIYWTGMVTLTDNNRAALNATTNMNYPISPQTKSRTSMEISTVESMSLAQQPVNDRGVVSSTLKRLVKPLLLEVGVLMIIQAVGFPFLAKFLTSILAVRRLRPLKLLLSPKHVKFLSTGMSRIWKGLIAGYSKTSASKIVNRSKKIFKSFLHHDDHDHDDVHDDHDHDDVHDDPNDQTRGGSTSE